MSVSKSTIRIEFPGSRKKLPAKFTAHGTVASAGTPPTVTATLTNHAYKIDGKPTQQPSGSNSTWVIEFDATGKTGKGYTLVVKTSDNAMVRIGGLEV